MGNLLASNVSAIIDLVALIIILISTISGLKKGFAKTFVSIFGATISLILAILLGKVALNFIQDKFGLIDKISKSMEGVVTKIFGNTVANTTLQEATETSLKNNGLAGWIINIIISVKGESNVPMDTTLNQVISPMFGYYIGLGICVLILYILFRILFFLFGEVIKKLYKVKLINVTDKSLGLVLGLIRGIIILQIAILIINVIPISIMQDISVKISETKITSVINKINAFDLIVRKMSRVDIVNIIIDCIQKVKI